MPTIDDDGNDYFFEDESEFEKDEDIEDLWDEEDQELLDEDIEDLWEDDEDFFEEDRFD